MQEIRLSNKTNKLELDPYSYQLQDVESPELFREMFPYTETPKIAFNYRRVPEKMRKISSSRIRHFVTDSSRVLRTQWSRWCISISSCMSLVVRTA